MAERMIWDDKYIRRQIISSSPELRALESQLHACALARYNTTAVVEKATQNYENKMKDKEYARLLDDFGQQEQISNSITSAEKYAKKLEIQRMLQDQIAEKAALKAQQDAEKAVQMMSEVDEGRELSLEKEQKIKDDLAHRKKTRDFLLQQTRLKELKKQQDELKDKNLIRKADEYNLRSDLQKDIERHEKELERLHLNKRELSLVKQLEKGQEKREAINNLRLEIEVLEKEEEEKRFAGERKLREAHSKVQLKEGWDNQIRYKQEESNKEQAKETEYRNMLLEVLAEEARLDQLVAEAQRRRRLDHRLLVDRLLEERRAMRATIMRQKREEDHQALQYEQLRKEILEEEEKQLLLKHAPQLMPYYTPKLLSKLRQLL